MNNEKTNSLLSSFKKEILEKFTTKIWMICLQFIFSCHPLDMKVILWVKHSFLKAQWSPELPKILFFVWLLWSPHYEMVPTIFASLHFCSHGIPSTSQENWPLWPVEYGWIWWDSVIGYCGCYLSFSNNLSGESQLFSEAHLERSWEAPAKSMSKLIKIICPSHAFRRLRSPSIFRLQVHSICWTSLSSLFQNS